MCPHSVTIAARAWLVSLSVFLHAFGVGAHRIVKDVDPNNVLQIQPHARVALIDPEQQSSSRVVQAGHQALLQTSHKRAHAHAHAGSHLHAHAFGGRESDAADRSHAEDSPSTHTLVCAAIAVAGALVGLMLWPYRDALEASKASGEEQTQGPRERLCLLDNAKVFGQFLVVWNHWLFYTSMGEYIDGTTLMSGSQDLLKRLLTGNRAVMMPTIVFISGICSQGVVSQRKLHRFVQYLVAPMLMWVCFCKPVIVDAMVAGQPEKFWTSLHQFARFQSFHEEWYLQALVLWRALAFLLWSNVRPSVAFLSMMGLSLFGGYYQLDAGPTWWMKLAEVIGFLPYFAVGYVFPFHGFCRAVPRPSNAVALVCGVLVVFWSYVWMPMLIQTPLPDGHGDYKCCDAGHVFQKAVGWDHSLYWVTRLAKTVVELPPMLALIFLVLPRGETPLTWVGPHTLYPFLFHLVAHTWRSRLLAMLPLPQVTSTTGHVLVIIASVPYCLACIAFFASRPWRSLFGWCLSPAWLDPIMISMASDRAKPSAPENSKPATKKDPGAGAEQLLLGSLQTSHNGHPVEAPLDKGIADEKRDALDRAEVASTAATSAETASTPDNEDILEPPLTGESAERAATPEGCQQLPEKIAG